jgi:hypothetical protein
MLCREVHLSVRRPVVLGLLVSLLGCQGPQPEPPSPPQTSPRIEPEPDKDPADASLGPPDHFYEAYQDYMDPAQRREYLKTPEDERFARFGYQLLDYELRASLLRQHEEELTREERDAYKQLPTAKACREFIASRAGRAHGDELPVRGGGISPVDSASREKERP